MIRPRVPFGQVLGAQHVRDPQRRVADRRPTRSAYPWSQRLTGRPRRVHPGYIQRVMNKEMITMSEQTSCVVVGGGPAGMIAGLLLARAGVEVTVLEKHPDFLRDFRGDTVHPSTLTLLDELGLGDRFDALPHSELTSAGFPTEDGSMMKLADLTRLKVAHPYIAMVPQWDFLDLLAESARKEPTFTLRMETEMTG